MKKDNSQDDSVFRAGEEDIPLIREMASIAFRDAYKSILSPEQIEYMMEWMYSAESLERQMTLEHNSFFIYQGRGYVSIRPDGQCGERLLFHLEKLYVLPGYRKCGIGAVLLKKALDYAGQCSAGRPFRVELNVNRYNNAVDFYLHQGFVIDRDVDNPIGNGFFMNDHIMLLDF